MTHLRRRSSRELTGLVLTAAALGAARIPVPVTESGARSRSGGPSDDRWDFALPGDRAALC
ncbi:hypothetical protein ACFV4N_21190 [Actinosynnema sp. NPDC059797]